MIFSCVNIRGKIHVKIASPSLYKTFRVRLGAFTARAAGLAARGDGAEQNPEEGKEGAARDEAGTNQLELQGPNMRRHIAELHLLTGSLSVEVHIDMVTNCAIARHP